MTQRVRLEPLDIGGVRLYAGGEGTPVVLVHGLGGSSANWLEVFPGLVGRHRVIAVDLPGHGGSAPLPHGSRIDDYADAVARALDVVAAGPAHVVGHSLGGHVATRLATRRPLLVRGLLLVSPSGLSTLEPAARLAASFSSVLRPGRFVQPVAGRLSGNRWFRRLTLEPFMVADAEALPPSAVRALFRDLRAHTDVRGAARAMGRDDPRPALGDVRCPAIVLWGARDAQLPLDDAVEHARRLGARLRVVADCGHLVIAERPAAVIDALAALALAPSS